MTKEDYVHKDSRTLEEKPQVFTRWIDPTIEELKQENQKYKEVINKAIEYIKSYKTDYSPYELSDYNVRQILDILKGV